ncbi:MAG: adenosylhomocysteinase [Desulforhopalus sp.]|jgi:adenosylhomocysteinase
MASNLLDFALASYRKEEFPCLYHQYHEWSDSRPLAGVRVFDATPVFKNTCPKYAALIAAGADLTVGLSGAFLGYPEVLKLLSDLGVKTAQDEFVGGEYDVVLDCAGRHHLKTPTRGFVELTRTGVPFYESSSHPCISVDNSKTKLLEDYLGTGDGFMRGLSALDFQSVVGRIFLVFGFGKVGKGICMRLHQAGAIVHVVDKVGQVQAVPHIPMIDIDDVAAVTSCANVADCIVTATGVAGALAGKYPVSAFVRSGVVLANIGAEDEFGPDIDDKDILNNNKSLNFILEDPTKMCFIDATMALHNESGLYLWENDCAPGVMHTPPALDEKFMQMTREKGKIAEDLKLLDWLLDEVQNE